MSGGGFLLTPDAFTVAHVVHYKPGLTMADKIARKAKFGKAANGVMPGVYQDGLCILPGGSPMGPPYCGKYVKTTYKLPCDFSASGLVGSTVAQNGTLTAAGTLST